MCHEPVTYVTAQYNLFVLHISRSSTRHGRDHPCMAQSSVSWLPGKSVQMSSISLYRLIWVCIHFRLYPTKRSWDIAPVTWEGQILSWSPLFLCMLCGIPNNCHPCPILSGWHSTRYQSMRYHMKESWWPQVKGPLYHSHYETANDNHVTTHVAALTTGQSSTHSLNVHLWYGLMSLHPRLVKLGHQPSPHWSVRVIAAFSTITLWAGTF